MKKSFTLLLTVLTSVYALSLPYNNPFTAYSPSSAEEIRSCLYVVAPDATATLLDGDLTQYDPSFSNGVDGMDARKMSNFSENLGMVREGSTLVIERRHTIEATDTIFFKLWNVVQERAYQFQFITTNLDHPGLSGFLEDSYLHTSTPVDLNGTSTIDFSVNADPASSTAYRFRLVFATVAEAALPLTFTSTKAYEQNNNIVVDWMTEHEQDIKKYGIEKSTDGIRFNNITDMQANKLAVNSYTWTDIHSSAGYNYYRIQTTGSNGNIIYSPVVKVFKETQLSNIRVFPNPVTDNTIFLKMENQPAGLYVIKLLNNFGQPVMVKQIQYPGGSSTTVIRPGQNIAPGLYKLDVASPGGGKTNINLMF